ncbi:L,D-transpeptidase [Effusibacillus consociatus]|uniref:L,D-transpeptidase n=1 Tax=Effusibacillus consociatus TaxID=1117041 RepID=A0ABV9PY56_9BACL
MKRPIRIIAYSSIFLLAAGITGCGQNAETPSSGEQTPVASQSAPPDTSNTQGATASAKGTGASQPSVITPLDWSKPSGGEYPKIKQGDAIWIDVSIADQRVYIKNGDETIYTMVTSSGLDTEPGTSTPRGTFVVEPERGDWFFAPQYQQGAKYWVSWKNHGEFLFHSVAMDKNGNVIEEEAKKLGQKASHGCFRLTVPDAKWIYDNIPVKTKVVVRD